MEAGPGTLIKKYFFWTNETYRIHGFEPQKFGVESSEIIERSLACYDLPDRSIVLKAFQRCVERGEGYDLEFPFTSADKQRKWIRTIASAIYENGRIVKIIGNIIDITKRKQEELLNETKLYLIQFANEHSLEDFLEETLRKVQKIANSLTGFYYFLEDDQKIFTSQSLQIESHKIEKKSYEISYSEILRDCIRQGKPIICNDCNSLESRKEMPEECTKLTRQLAVPLLRNDKIKLVVGVANKPSDYNETDIKNISFLADFLWNIKERKQYEEKMLLSEQRLRLHSKLSPLGFLEWDEGFHAIEWNKACQEIFGYTREEAIGRHAKELILPVEVHHLVDEIFHSLLNQTGGQYSVNKNITKDGRIIICEWFNTTLVNPDGKTIGMASICRDITEQKQMEQKLISKEREYRTLVESLPYCVVRYDLNLQRIYANPAWENGKALDLDNSRVFPNPSLFDEYMQKIRKVLKSGESQTIELTWENNKGENIFMEYALVAEYDHQGKISGVLSVGQDITQRKSTELERQAHLKFFENMDLVNRTIQSSHDLDEMMKKLLDVMLSIFDSDRVFLLWPCDPDSKTWTVPMESNKTEYPGVFELNLQIPMDPQVAKTFRILLATDGPVIFGPGSQHLLPKNISEQFNIKSFIAMSIYPKGTTPWQLGMHQCSYPRIWTKEEMRLFEAIGRRLADALCSLISYQDLRENERFLDTIVNHIPNMLFIKDAKNLEYVKFNKASEQLMGYSANQLLGKTEYDFLPKKEADFFMNRDRKVLTSGNLMDIPEETIRDKNKEERVFHTQKIPILDETGMPQYLLSISENITTRKLTEKTLQEKNDFIRIILDSVDEGFIVLDPEYRILSANRTFCKDLDTTEEEIIGKLCYNVLHGKDYPCFLLNEYCPVQKTFATGNPDFTCHMHKNVSGAERHIELKSYPIIDESNKVVSVIETFSDVTEKRKLEEQLYQSQKMEAIGQLAGGVAHDFNNMLGVITLSADMALDDTVDSIQQERFEQILEAAQRSSEITRQLLAFARKQPMVPRIINLNETIEGMLKLLRRLIGENIELIWKPGTEIWQVKMDPVQIDQIMANLSVNARDAIAGIGKITVATQNIYLDATFYSQHVEFLPGEYVMLVVSDDGSGMDKTTVNKIFEPFFTTKELGHGTGLGLSTVYGIVKQNSGFINVYSELGYGSTFKIYFPRHMVVKETKKKSVMFKEIQGTERILLVEDESAFLNTVKILLKELGYEVLSFSKPSQALRAVKEDFFDIDLLITDVIMPEMTGPNLEKELKILYPSLKSLFMSGYIGDIIADHGVLDENVNFIHKPFSKRKIALKIREVLDK